VHCFACCCGWFKNVFRLKCFQLRLFSCQVRRWIQTLSVETTPYDSFDQILTICGDVSGVLLLLERRCGSPSGVWICLWTPLIIFLSAAVEFAEMFPNPYPVAEWIENSCQLEVEVNLKALQSELTSHRSLFSQIVNYVSHPLVVVCLKSRISPVFLKKSTFDHPTVVTVSFIVFLYAAGQCKTIRAWHTGCFTIVETKRQLLKPLSMTLFIFLFPDCRREIVNLSIY